MFSVVFTANISTILFRKDFDLYIWLSDFILLLITIDSIAEIHFIVIQNVQGNMWIDSLLGPCELAYRRVTLSWFWATILMIIGFVDYKTNGQFNHGKWTRYHNQSKWLKHEVLKSFRIGWTWYAICDILHNERTNYFNRKLTVES